MEFIGVGIGGMVDSDHEYVEQAVTLINVTN